jgi:type IV pilus assembly protein PilC
MMTSIRATHLTDFLSELTLLLEENIPLHEALGTLRQHETDRTLLRLLDEIQAENGNLADALEKHPHEFEPFLVVLLRDAVNPTEMLRKIVDYRESMAASGGNLGAKLLYSFSYFSAVLVVFLIIMVAMLHYVVPAFAELFAGFGADLPYLTQKLIEISNAIQNYSWGILAGLLILLGLFWRWRTHLLPHFPIFGHLYRKLALVRFLQTCAFMLSNGTTLNQAVTAAIQVMGYSLPGVQQQLTQGKTLSEALSNTSYHFPQKLLHIAAVGEKAKKLDKLFIKLANIYTKQLHQSIEPTTKLLGVLLTVILGIIIGLFVIAMYIPIFNMGKVI